MRFPEQGAIKPELQMRGRNLSDWVSGAR